MTKYRYPYISDKKMYAAVMGACSYIRETGWFNKAVSYYANKFGVDSVELANHIRERQSAGQKAKNKDKPKRKYRYFLFAIILETCEGSQRTVKSIKAYRGLSKETVFKRLSDECARFSMKNDTGSYWSLAKFCYIVGDENGYTTKEEAEKDAEKIWTKSLETVEAMF